MYLRNSYLDFIKGIAIILVITGHIIQFSLEKTEFLNNPVFIFIYTFHMPLFMAISGYLFYYSDKKTIANIIINKFHQLIVPLFLWTFVFCVFKIINTSESTFSQNTIFYFKMLPRQYWFLIILFISAILLSFSKTYLNKWYWHLFVIFIILLIPDFSSIRYLKYMYPFFLIGFLYNRYSSYINKYLIQIVLIAGITFILGLYFWKKDYFIYSTDYSILNMNGLINHTFRYCIGTSGSIVVLFIARLISDRFKGVTLQELGKETLGIYLIHFVLLELISYKLIIIPDFLYLQVLVNSFILLLISYSITKLLNQWKLSQQFLLGKPLKAHTYSLK